MLRSPIYKGETAIIGDLGISKPVSSEEDDNEIYGIIPYVAPEIFLGQKYTKASDIYSFGMIMWEFLTGRRPFWDKIHDTELIIDICDNIRPETDINAPEGYIELIQSCWDSVPYNRPTADDIISKIKNNRKFEDYSITNYKHRLKPDGNSKWIINVYV
ncbi:4581_t:CDS:2 [Funneliformis geosporum]|uniref:4581_t:CDS:1 n=1 Tax=Funneliformis geosporum TaxID=1117311 RepID=A0A9W4WWB8_9GLOM|nr:4581_t:CDS:2 [Funneliformis geosporum]